METTLNINTEVLEVIMAEAKSRKISCSSMIIFLMQKVMEEDTNPIVIGRLVQYQQKRKPEEWHTFHIQLREDEYEYFMDLRKFLKMSVSLILAYAVKRYVKKQNKMNDTDNNRNPYRNYVVTKEFIDNIICWKLFWGYPPSIIQHILQ